MAVVKWILRYVAGTLKSRLPLWEDRGGTAPQVQAYSHNDLAGNIDTRKSTSSRLFFYCNSLVSWHVLKKKVVALSSCEAEYVAATTADTQAV
jgi:hypothetical protein